ncbi:helix-turn-helix domain-containing protein [Kaistia dalseonensis]|uniref:CRP/FNR family nitrogen fixation transcriptional regulator n=1 Tax=Kaistia dalseonensis TaxID=410840 RepID=A0ABU0H6G4_9HYPH|nr:helix-turn-helix domain-containing protein [Kaistia dalseonensis]MCX5495317.1 helix-turn-helix domain-containing protein [Kaistia dalseonensis]MDQ0437903.1 CRP/FNR family nitrogen fixation transcriptional regulator [Kaistia dalseonensis]
MLMSNTQSLEAKRIPSAVDWVASRSLAGAGRRVEDVFEQLGIPVSFEKDGEICAESEPAEYIYKVVSGTVRSTKILDDGRRQIGAFYMAGDIFGLEPGDDYHFSAEAVTHAEVLAVKRSTAFAWASQDGDFARLLWNVTAQHLQRAQDHILLLGRKTALERVATFILEMADRLAKEGALELPMMRQDIADYLGLTIETVSRTMTHLESTHAISLNSSRQIALRSRSGLNRVNAC